MDRLTATLLGAAAAVGVGPALLASAAQANPVPVAATYSELLAPIPNAVERLQLANAADAAAQPQLIEAQYNQYQDHHHHHQQRHNRRWYYQHGYVWLNGSWMLRPPPHHHHHHHQM
jgi:hypothetical protein